jgi:hypothetical protein
MIVVKLGKLVCTGQPLLPIFLHGHVLCTSFGKLDPFRYKTRNQITSLPPSYFKITLISAGDQLTCIVCIVSQ